VDLLPDAGDSEMGQKRYSARLKFDVVLGALRSPEKSDAEVARAMEVHPALLSRWKREFQEKGPEVFVGSDEVGSSATTAGIRRPGSSASST
jgi:transposase-like protein